MRLAVVTSVRAGRAAACLPALCASPHLTVSAVVYLRRPPPINRRWLMRKLRKTARIGLLGALNGLRLRRWYADHGSEDVAAVATRLGIPLASVDSLDQREARDALSGADLGLSVGNPYIPRRIYSLPRFGMINVHEELLPEYPGAQSIIWPILEDRGQTGFTIHQMDERIDTGPILFREGFAIELKDSLRETVAHNRARTGARLPAALVHVCENYETLRASAKPQPAGKAYTTPSIGQFLAMLRAHRRMRREGSTRPSLSSPR